jgi:hypothetical protein
LDSYSLMKRFYDEPESFHKTVLTGRLDSDSQSIGFYSYKWKYALKNSEPFVAKEQLKYNTF